MLRMVTRNAVFLAVVCSISLMLIIYSILFVRGNYMVPLFWDQWEFAIDLAKSKQDTLSLQYLFAAHNEHVIATTKLLFFLDYYFFSLTNGPLIVSIGIATFCIAWLLAKLLFVNDKENKYFYPFFLLFSASGFSLAQWENLLWGFQPQFYLVLIFTLLSCLIGLKISDREQITSPWWFAGLIVTTGLGVFSMGNGIALPISILILLVLRCYRPIKTVLYGAAGALLIGVFIVLTRGAPAVGEPALKTFGNFISFFFGMLGSPITNKGVIAAIFGLLLFGAYGILFLYHVLIPFLRRRPLDDALVGLFALASFLFATAVGAAWGRFSLGPGAALASRYATPMLVLWMTLFAILFRVTVRSEHRPSNRQVRSGLCILLALSVAAWTSLKPGNIASVGQANAVNQAGYFLSSGVGIDEQLLKLYPSPGRIRPAIDFLRDAKLNLFAENPELFALSWKQWTDKPARARELGYVDKVQHLSASAWQAAGWATNAARQTPRWIVAVDASQNVVVPILRGPSAEGLSLVVKSNGRLVFADTKQLDSLPPHLWQYLRLNAFDTCKEGEKSNLSITLEDNGWGLGA